MDESPWGLVPEGKGESLSPCGSHDRSVEEPRIAVEYCGIIYSAFI